MYIYTYIHNVMYPNAQYLLTCTQGNCLEHWQHKIFPPPTTGCINFRIVLGYWSTSPPSPPSSPTGINPCTCNVYVYGRPRNRRRTTCVKYSILCLFYDRSLATLTPSICVFCMEFHPRDSSHLYVGTDTGRVHHVTRYGRRPIPRFHTTTTENEGTLQYVHVNAVT